MLWISRRSAAGSGMVLAQVVGLLAVTAPGDARAEANTLRPDENLHFTVYRDGGRIGHHSVVFREEDGNLHVKVEIDFEISFAFITLYRYSHRNHEIWRNGRLVSLESRTEDNGDSYQVSARATEEGLKIESSDGDYTAPAGILPTSYWHPNTVKQSRLLDSQHGRLLDIAVAPAGHDTVALGIGQVTAKRYDVGGDLKLSIWYGPDDEWSKLRFNVKGSDIRYQRRTAEQLRQLTDGRAGNDG